MKGCIEKMSAQMMMADVIEQKLRDAFAPQHLSVTDDSESHRGHAGYMEGGQSHFIVEITSDHFEGQSRLTKHRAVHDALGKDVIGKIHALALKINP